MTSVEVGQLGSIFTQAAAYADPASWHSAAKRIRDKAPILRVAMDGYPEFWAITKHADVMTIERNPDVFTNAPIPTLTPAAQVDAIADTPVKTLVQMDGDEHKAHRNIVNEWFKPKNLKTLQGRIDLLARRFVDHMADQGGECDFVSDVALHFPLHVILSILGLPESDFPRMLKLTQELFGAEDPDIARLAEDGALLSVLLDFVSYFTDLANIRRETPTSDLASVIANATINGALLDDLDMLGHYVIIATAGHDTTANSIGGGLLALIQHPEEFALLQAQPDLIDHAADELIRYESPVKHFARTCQEPFTLRRVTFEPGDLLYLSFASANRDEEVFPDPHRLDVRRENASNHLAFGFGRHFCLGAHLARMEVRALFKELLGRLDHINWPVSRRGSRHTSCRAPRASLFATRCADPQPALPTADASAVSAGSSLPSREAASLLGDDVSLYLAGPGIDRGAEREPQPVLDQTTLDGGGLPPASQAVGTDQRAEAFGVADNGFGAEQLAHRAFGHGHVTLSIHPSHPGFEQFGYFQIDGGAGEAHAHLVAVGRTTAVGVR